MLYVKAKYIVYFKEKKDLPSNKHIVKTIFILVNTNPD